MHHFQIYTYMNIPDQAFKKKTQNCINFAQNKVKLFYKKYIDHTKI